MQVLTWASSGDSFSDSFIKILVVSIECPWILQVSLCICGCLLWLEIYLVYYFGPAYVYKDVLWLVCVIVSIVDMYMWLLSPGREYFAIVMLMYAQYQLLLMLVWLNYSVVPITNCFETGLILPIGGKVRAIMTYKVWPLQASPRNL